MAFNYFLKKSWIAYGLILETNAIDTVNNFFHDINGIQSFVA